MPDGKYYRMTLIGNGIVDSELCIKTMEASGYKGFIDVEIFWRRGQVSRYYKSQLQIYNQNHKRKLTQVLLSDIMPKPDDTR